jgi:3-hydroxyisobutyrate dehydrogenase-like beta-hydroxyacid dehydrogenase
VIVGLVHPGEMGAAVGEVLAGNGHDVVWASEGRSEATRRRARAAGLRDVGTLAGLRDAAVVLSICPPHGALEVARAFASYRGVFVDANAIAPATAGLVAETAAHVVDGGIVGPPPHEPGTTRLYLSGDGADDVAALFAGSPLEARVLAGGIGAASALKMTYAAWTKGGAALLLAVSATARAHHVEDALHAEWLVSQPDLPARLERAERSATAKAWRWAGELDEIAETFAAGGQPDGFGRAAAEVYRTWAPT